MRIEDAAYLSRMFQSLDDNGQDKFRKLSESIKDDAANSTRIRIVSGYFGEDYVLELLSQIPTRRARSRCQVTLVFGYDNSTEFVHGKLRVSALKNNIVNLGYKKSSVDIRLFKNSAPLHTKLYGFLRNTFPVWYVGSANLSKAIEGDRHELMVRITGRSEALEAYVDNLLTHSGDVNSILSGGISGLPEFFSFGSLLFKPTRYRRFTYDAFEIKQADRRKISDQLGKNSKVPHSDPAAEGFGFNLLSAIGIEEDPMVGNQSRVRLRRYCIESVYGYWMPKPFVQKVQSLMSCDKEKERKKFLAIGENLKNMPDSELVYRFQEYLDASKEFFSNLEIQAVPRKEQIKSFKEFVDVRRKWLEDSNSIWIERNSSKFILEEMPNIWADPHASERFVTSICEDISAVLNSPERKPMIYGKLKERLGLIGSPTAEFVREKLESKITTRFFNESFWE